MSRSASTKPRRKVDWDTWNREFLIAELKRVRSALEDDGEPSTGPRRKPRPARGRESPKGYRTALDRLCEASGLTAFERDVLLLCAGMELEADFARLCAKAHGDPEKPYPTFSLALARLPESHWSAFSPGRPLRHWDLIEVTRQGGLLVHSPLRADERVLHYLLGLQYSDDRLRAVMDPVENPPACVPSQQRLAEHIARRWLEAVEQRAIPVIQLCGSDGPSKEGVAAAVAGLMEARLWSVSVIALPQDMDRLDRLLRLWEREAMLEGCILLARCEEIESGESHQEAVLSRLVHRMGGLLILTGERRHRIPHRTSLTFDVAKPRPEEQRAVWRQSLARHSEKIEHAVEQVAAHFHLGANEIESIATGAIAEWDYRRSAPEEPVELAEVVWETCRTQVRPRLDDLAQRIDSSVSWEDLVLPDVQAQTLREISIQLRFRATVYERWGFAAKSRRGLGITALFAGASGTGKTLAAEVLANVAHLDLYRIDLSAVVSKYIGETEKNLRKVFDAAEEGGAVLLFDEADALFGKRSEVKDSHDRYANIEVSYLLQRMESYRGLAILTTNLKDSLDAAFVRRIRFIVQFPFPDYAERREIWQRAFPAETPTQGLDANRLAQLNVAGGTIRNIALRAAFIAADRGEPVTMDDILRAARSEYDKLEKPLTEYEIRGWM